MRIKHKINVRIAVDDDMENLLFGLNDNLAEVTIDDYTQQSSGTINIPQATNEDLPLGDVDNIYGIWLEVDQTCDIKINGSNDVISLTVPTNGSTAKLAMEAAITSVNIAAPADADLSGKFCIWGE